jgi:hypothetical protein
VVRTFFNSFPALLVMASYLWGGCISCEQFFMLPGSKSDCCDRNKCKKGPKQSKSQAPQQDCQKMPLEQSSVAHPHPEIPLVLVGNSSGIVTDAQLFSVSELSLNPVTDSPPNLPILNASLLI